MDQNIHFAVTCLKDETFAEIEERLYKKYPDYRETNNTNSDNRTLDHH